MKTYKELVKSRGLVIMDTVLIALHIASAVLWFYRAATVDGSNAGHIIVGILMTLCAICWSFNVFIVELPYYKALVEEIKKIDDELERRQ
jgi:hypothetical protein